ncbi:MAG: hypothetical protein E3J90_14050 [Promethearchaeota archaeon]|nr:MAG: hypothetical protein E3J90_14050 [Candidatus Lokiarchaeota archaeon]
MKKKKFITKGMTPGELFDRFTILLQKSFFSDDYRERAEEYVAILDKNGFDGKFLRIICELQIININIWHLESDIRKDKEGELGLMEVGRRALRIRDYNRERTKRSNAINELMGESERDEKFELDQIKEKSNVDNLHRTSTL